METVSANRAFGGVQGVYRHASASTGTEMTFSVFVPPHEAGAKLPAGQDWITAKGYKPLITHLFVKGGKYLDSDAVFGVKPELIVDFKRGKDGIPAVHYDFVLMKA